jgi:ferrous iron transport protein B
MLIMSSLQISGLMMIIDISLPPVVSGLLGLPSDAATAILIGFLRKDMGIRMFVPLGMTPEQPVIASVVLAMYFLCVATFMVMLRELGWSDTLKSVALRLAAALMAGTALNLLLNAKF